MSSPCEPTPMQLFDAHLRDKNVTIVVGQNNDVKRFSVPNRLLRACSTWFAEALEESPFKEGETKIVELPEDSPTVFEAFQYYVYHRDLAFPNISTVDVLEHFNYCIDIWRFGDDYSVQGLQNAAMLRACHLLKKNDELDLPLAILAKCFSGTPSGSPLRKLAADYIVIMVKEGGIEMEHFAPLTCLPDLEIDFHESGNAYSRANDSEFPRYGRPIHNKRHLHVPSMTAVQQGDGEVRKTGYSDWDAFKPFCEKCAMKVGNARCGQCEIVLKCPCESGTLTLVCYHCCF